ncbi:barstar family protein [Rhodoferax saidenbachensis]|uniref:RNAse (Barnase) inhibitor barstar n=1 Tax=Rhodoferax saidenbachensis TaxID=1484693 RepID=A0ABU1ZM01_9BURK|nr:barstar family protein [Rhodoferax saidenbachensis]MDR7306572.1 RNAse (barnase) inhibitor barstar [Rhodoferax saidenbachensis]
MSRVKSVEVDLREVENSVGLHETLRDALGFPGWYGCNWDAFWDSITGLVEMPETLRLLGWFEFQQRLPRDAELMRSCLVEMTNRYPQSASSVIYE